MSIKYNGKTVAGRYKGQVVTNATKTQKGIIRVATDEEVNAGVSSALAITPEHLARKVDKQEGKSLISDTEIERLSKVDNYDDTQIKSNVENLNATTEQLLVDVNKKQNKLVAGEDVVLKENEDGTVTIDINATEVLTDNETIIQDDANVITAVGIKTKSEDLLYDWVGTSDEYDASINSGIITTNTRCLITDDEQSIVLNANLKVPTKVSQLANDSEFTTEEKLQDTKEELTNLFNSKIGKGDFVHLSGDEYIDGQKTFNTNINLSGINGGKITYNNSVDDTKSYIKIKNDNIIFSKDNTVENEKYVFTEDNLTAGNNIQITKDGEVFVINSTSESGGTNVLVDNETIVKNEEDIITAVGVHTKTDTNMYDWVGTKEDYELAYNAGYIEPNWVCWITDDEEKYKDNQESDIVLLDVIYTNQILEGNDKVGRELQGRLITKYIYPDAYDKLFKFYLASVNDYEEVNGTVVIYKKCRNGWKILEDKSIYDKLLKANGTVDFFMLDLDNEAFYLPVVLDEKANNNTYAYYKVADTLKSNSIQVEDMAFKANISLDNLDDIGESRFTDIYSNIQDVYSNIENLNSDVNNTIADVNEVIETKVSKSGDTMTGALTVKSERFSLNAVNHTMTKGVVPSEHKYTSYSIHDNQGAFLGEFYYRQGSDKSVYTAMACRNWDGTTSNYLIMGYDANGKSMFSFPKCTTKATTTSSASSSNVAVVVQNYVSGTSWYRVWSDGWIEQGGRTGSLGQGKTQSITFLKAFSNANYSVVATTQRTGNTWSTACAGNLTNSTMTITHVTNAGSATTISWYACGY